MSSPSFQSSSATPFPTPSLCCEAHPRPGDSDSSVSHSTGLGTGVKAGVNVLYTRVWVFAHPSNGWCTVTCSEQVVEVSFVELKSLGHFHRNPCGGGVVSPSAIPLTLLDFAPLSSGFSSLTHSCPWLPAMGVFLIGLVLFALLPTSPLPWFMPFATGSLAWVGICFLE